VDADGAVQGVFPTTWLDEGGTQVARFEFDDAPLGALRLDVVSLTDAVTSQVAPTPLTAPCSTVAVLVRDALPTSDVEFAAVDARTGAALAQFEVTVEVEGGLARTYVASEVDHARHWTLEVGDMRWNEFAGRAALRRLPVDAPFTWRVRASGYREAQGTANDAVLVPDAARADGAPVPRRVVARLMRD
jgi:hypothetical protein